MKCLTYDDDTESIHTFTPVCRRYKIAWWQLTAVNPVRLCVSILPNTTLDAVSKLLWSREQGCTTAEGVKGVKIYTRLCAHYWENALPLWSVYEWVDMFDKGRTSVIDSECLGCSSKATSARYSDILQNKLRPDNHIKRGCSHPAWQCSTSYYCPY
jgi:hypothetical protein